MLELSNLRWGEGTSDDMRPSSVFLNKCCIKKRRNGFLHEGLPLKVWHEDTPMLNDEFPDLLDRGLGPPVDLEVRLA